MKVFIEGKASQASREAFHKLFDKAGVKPRPRLVTANSRDEAFKDYEREKKQGNKALLLVDSEDPVENIEATWDHLRGRDPSWQRPEASDDTDILFMTTCMETWIVADQETLREVFKKDLQLNALPPLNQLERRDRKDVFKALQHATRDCSTPYAKGDISFKVLARLNPDELAKHLPSFRRCIRILRENLA